MQLQGLCGSSEMSKDQLFYYAAILRMQPSFIRTAGRFLKKVPEMLVERSLCVENSDVNLFDRHDRQTSCDTRV